MSATQQALQLPELVARIIYYANYFSWDAEERKQAKRNLAACLLVNRLWHLEASRHHWQFANGAELATYEPGLRKIYAKSVEHLDCIALSPVRWERVSSQTYPRLDTLDIRVQGETLGAAVRDLFRRKIPKSLQLCGNSGDRNDFWCWLINSLDEHDSADEEIEYVHLTRTPWDVDPGTGDNVFLEPTSESGASNLGFWDFIAQAYLLECLEIDAEVRVAPLTPSQITSLMERVRLWALNIPTLLSGAAIESALAMSSSCFKRLRHLKCELDVDAILLLVPQLQHCSMYRITIRGPSQRAISAFENACNLGSLDLWFKPDDEDLEYSEPFVDPDELITLCQHQRKLSSLSINFEAIGVDHLEQPIMPPFPITSSLLRASVFQLPDMHHLSFESSLAGSDLSMHDLFAAAKKWSTLISIELPGTFGFADLLGIGNAILNGSKPQEDLGETNEDRSLYKHMRVINLGRMEDLLVHQPSLPFFQKLWPDFEALFTTYRSNLPNPRLEKFEYMPKGYC